MARIAAGEQDATSARRRQEYEAVEGEALRSRIESAAGESGFGLGGGLDYFLSTVFNYPTLAECYKVSALNAANKLAM